MTVAEACAKAAVVRARVVEVVYTKDVARVNVVLLSGAPRTWKCKR
jgi:S-adenosylmethionine:diacylglycerol 3-amino-3-carboxypropyl transferase